MSLPDPLPAVSGDENTSLFQARGCKPLWEDRRGYVRWPANLCHRMWLTVASSYVNFLLVLVPLGIVAGAVSWNPNYCLLA
jgi:Ca2+:H+ antiporter